MDRLFFASVTALIGFVIAAPVFAQDRPAENTGPNANITRWASGKLTFREVESQRITGESSSVFPSIPTAPGP